MSVSIVIPVFNASCYLRETLASVQNQTWKDWELILVDDGSVDGSAELMESLIGSRSLPARLLRHPGGGNRGTSATRNLGLQQASGDFVCFLDADDVWKPEFLASLVEQFRRHPDLTMAYSPCIYWHADDRGSGAPPPDTVQDVGVSSEGEVDPFTLFTLFLEHENTVPSPSGVMLRRSAVVEVGGWEESFRGMCDDQVLYAKLLLAGGGVSVAAQPLYCYRQHAASLCRTVVREGRYDESRRTFLTWLLRYLRERTVEAEPLLKVVREQLTLLEIRSAIDRRWDGAGGRIAAVKDTLSAVAAIRQAPETCCSYKVLRYGVGHFVAKIIASVSASRSAVEPSRPGEATCNPAESELSGNSARGRDKRS